MGWWMSEKRCCDTCEHGGKIAPPPRCWDCSRGGEAGEMPKWEPIKEKGRGEGI